MRELINWQTYDGNRLKKARFNELQLDALHELFKEAHAHGDEIDRDRFLARIKYNTVLVGSNRSGVAAMSVYNYQPYTKGSYIYLEALAVSEESRRRGIGSQALTSVINEAIILGCSNVQLESRKGAVEFYRAHGFSYDYNVDTNSPYTPMRLYLPQVDSSEETTLRSLTKTV